jgi:hypothetical protein
MRALELAVLYMLVGAGCAAALIANWRLIRPSALDVGIVFAFWPLYAPFLLMRSQRRLPRSAAAPDQRIAGAKARVGEIDLLLAQSEFSEEAAVARQAELEARGDHRAAAAAAGRVENIRRLRALRGRFAAELAEIEELLAQLRVQSEVLRFTDQSAADNRELIARIEARIAALDTMLEIDTA